MALKEQINNDIKAALLGGDRFCSDILRNFKAVVLNEEVAQNKREEGLDDESIERLVAQEVKKRNESADLYKKAGREELAKNELKEIEVLAVYLPKQLSEAEIVEVVEKNIADMNVSDMSGMGQVIGRTKQQLGNTADGAIIARIVKELLSKQ